MPLYEYFCPSCNRSFEALRPALDADAPTVCPNCRQASSQRILSLFAPSVKTSGQTMTPVPAGGSGCGCGNGMCGCHHH